MDDNEINYYAKIVWNYHHMHQKLEKVDCLLVSCSYDIRVAEWAAKLYLDGYAPWIIFSGNNDSVTKALFEKSEAETFADIAIGKGVPKHVLLIENKSMNTGENIQFTKKLLMQKGLDFQKFIVVQKPFMERRVFATFKKVWPEKEVIVTSPPLSYEQYINGPIKDLHINVMVGDLQRIREYPERGFQIAQQIPTEVWDAYKALVAAGFNKRLIV